MSRELSDSISLMSAPAAKAFGEPVSTMQPMLSSASNAAAASASSRTSVELRALSASGRLSVIQPTRPCVETMIVE